MRIASRLAKLENVLPPAPAVGWTYEEERVFLYELVLAGMRAGKSPQLRKRLKEFADRIAGEISRTASRPMTDIYRNHISYVEEVWVLSGRTLPFVPPVLGSNYDDWFLPGLTERRLAVRRRPSVIALIGDTVASGSWWHSELATLRGELRSSAITADRVLPPIA